MDKLSSAHKAEMLKRLIKRQSPTETNMGEQTPPGMGVPGMPNTGMPGLPGMEQGMGAGPMPGAIPQPTIPPIQTENAESYDQNPILSHGNELVKQLGLDKLTKSNKTELTPIDVIIKNEADASQIWKVIGGINSVGGRVWQDFSEKSKLHTDGRNYFISCYSKYMQNPEKFKKTNPREALLIKHINKVMEEE